MSTGLETPGQAVDSSAIEATPGSSAWMHGVDLLEEGHRLEVLAPAVDVGDPLARLARVVEVEHRGHGVDPQPVGVHLLEPEQGVGQQEALDLEPAVVEHERAPVGVRAPGPGVLVQLGAVEAGQGPLVAGEVGRDPVEQDADAVGVQGVDEELEVVGRAPRRLGGEERGDLVAPRAAVGVVHHRQQLDVGEPHVGDVGGQLVGGLGEAERHLGVGGVAAPRAEVDLVDRHGPDLGVERAAPLDPPGVGPRVVRLGHDRRRGRRHLGLTGDRVGVLDDRAVGAVDLELVALAHADAGDEQLPDARRARPASSGASRRPSR